LDYMKMDYKKIADRILLHCDCYFTQTVFIFVNS
jgi:hypothetical protein